MLPKDSLFSSMPAESTEMKDENAVPGKRDSFQSQSCNVYTDHPHEAMKLHKLENEVLIYHQKCGSFQEKQEPEAQSHMS